MRTTAPPATRGCRAAALLTAVALGLLVVPGPAQAGPADRKREVDAGIHALQDAMAGTSKELQQAYAALAEAQHRLPLAQAELASAEAARDEAQRKDFELAARLTAAQQSEVNQAAEIEDAGADIAETESSIGRIAAQAYRGGGISPGLSLVLGAGGPDDFADRYLLVDTALRSQSSAMARLQQQRAVLANQQMRLEAVREQVADLRAEAAANLEVARKAETDAAARKTEVEQIVQAQTAATTAIRARQAEEKQRLDQLQAERDELAAELRRIAAEERRRAEAERRRAEEERRRAAERASREEARDKAPSPAAGGGGGGGGGGGSSENRSVLLRPTNTRITSHYGWRVHPIYGTRRMHTGTDFGKPCGTPIRAAEDGRVVRAGDAGGYGNQIVLNHGVIDGDALATSYNHMSSYAVRSGRVSRGQVIGYIGTTGASTGCHLHFEVFVNGDHVNPMRYL